LPILKQLVGGGAKIQAGSKARLCSILCQYFGSSEGQVVGKLVLELFHVPEHFWDGARRK
jgi:hypothetical protein